MEWWMVSIYLSLSFLFAGHLKRSAYKLLPHGKKEMVSISYYRYLDHLSDIFKTLDEIKTFQVIKLLFQYAAVILSYHHQIMITQLPFKQQACNKSEEGRKSKDLKIVEFYLLNMLIWREIAYGQFGTNTEVENHFK